MNVVVLSTQFLILIRNNINTAYKLHRQASYKKLIIDIIIQKIDRAKTEKPQLAVPKHLIST